MFGIEDIYSIPLSVENKYYGSISVLMKKDYKRERKFDNNSIQLIEILANLFSKVIQRIKDKEALSEEKEKYRLTSLQLESLMDHSDIGIMIEDKSRRVIKINKPFCELFGLKEPKSLIEHDRLKIAEQVASKFEEPEKYLENVDMYFESKKDVLKNEIKLKDGRILERDFIPLTFEKSEGFLWIYRDITRFIEYQNELKKSHQRFSELVSQLNDFIWSVDNGSKKVNDLSNSFEKFFGYRFEDYKRNPNFLMEMVHPDDKIIVERSEEELKRLGYSVEKYRIIRGDGSEIWLEVRKSLLYNLDNEVIQVGGNARDITKNKELEIRLKHKSYALDSSPIAIGIADLDGILIYANEAYINLYGYKSKEEILGMHIKEFARTDPIFPEVMRTIKSGNDYFGEGIIKKISGEFTKVTISAKFIYDNNNNPIGMLALFNDISERKEAERIIKEQNEELKELVALRDKLLSIITHDLRGPFNSIFGFARFLLDDYEKINDEEKKEYIGYLYDATQAGYILLENLLCWARSQYEKAAVERIILNLKELVEQNIKPYSGNADRKRIKINNEIDAELNVTSDPNLLGTVIRNIFNNAIKFTNEEGHVDFSAVEKNKTIELIIADDGVGMEADLVLDINEGGSVQTRNGTKTEEGTGLGLMISQDLITSINGEMLFESEIDKGTRVIIKLPK